MASSSWIIDALGGTITRQMLRVASVATWNTSTPFLQPLGWAKISFLGQQRLHQTVGTDDFHDPFQVIGEHIQAHLGTPPDQLSRQE
jgi:hypothetical protein